MEKKMISDACSKIIGLLRASGPCDKPDIALELREQCQGVYWSNLKEVYDSAMAKLFDSNIIESIAGSEVYDVNPYMYDNNDNWIGPTEF